MDTKPSVGLDERYYFFINTLHQGGNAVACRAVMIVMIVVMVSCGGPHIVHMCSPDPYLQVACVILAIVNDLS